MSEARAVADVCRLLRLHTTPEAGVAGGRTPGIMVSSLETCGAIGIAILTRRTEHWRRVAAPPQQHKRHVHAVAIILPWRSGNGPRLLCVLPGEMLLRIAHEHIAEYQIGNAIGGERFHGTQQHHLYFTCCPNTRGPLCVHGVVLIPLESHWSWS